MELSNSPAWKTAWTASQPLSLDYQFEPAASAKWSPAAIRGLVARDLGLAASSHGKLSAQHLRLAGSPDSVASEWRALDCDFNFFLVLQGSAKIENSSGRSCTLGKGAAALHPPFLRYRLFDFSPDFEMFEMIGPADAEVITGRATPLPARASQFAGQQAQYLFEREDSFVQGAGPRRFFSYRDLGTSGPTEGRIHIHVVKAAEAMPGGTGWHTHSMRQIFWVLSGEAGFNIKGHPEVARVRTHDAVCVAAGQGHDVSSFTPDYSVLEVCMPAEYTTEPIQTKRN